MKIRDGFVSNSSSASFTIPLSILSQYQISDIYTKDEYYNGSWHIHEDEINIYGQSSSMIFDMRKYLDEIGVDKSKITWEYR